MENSHALFATVPVVDRKDELCKKLGAIHGTVVRRHEKSGEQAYMACPNCLAEYGDRELTSRHLAINLDKFFDPARTRVSSGKDGKSSGTKGYAQCMKSGDRFTVGDLLNNYPTLEERGIRNHSPKLVVEAGGTRYLVPDGNGNLVPDAPGLCTPLNQLGHGHPAIQYCLSRNFDPSLLYAQFGAAWCYKESPEGEHFGNRFWRKHADGWKSTPQGRIIFFTRCSGVVLGWQARYLEMKEELPDGSRRTWVWHPYREAWELEPVWDGRKAPVKYITAPGSLKSLAIAGYDNAVAQAKVREIKSPYCLLTEGPLDAARDPAFGLPVFGKTVSEAQALLISIRFRRAILGFDTDVHGRKACEQAERVLGRLGVRTARFFEDGTDVKHDLGEMTYEDVATRVATILGTL